MTKARVASNLFVEKKIHFVHQVESAAGVLFRAVAFV
jgi:hypothetical protein